MGCINSVPNTKDISIINNKAFDDLDNGDFIGGIIYIRNMEWCLKASKYIEGLCFILASYQPEDIIKVKKIASKITSSKLAKSPAGQEFNELIQYIDNVGEFYMLCMHSIRKHTANNTTLIFNDIAKYIKTVTMFGIQKDV